MRYDVIIPLVLLAGIAAFSVSRKGFMAKPMTPKEQASQAVRDITERAKAKLESLRRDRRKLVDDFARKMDALKAAKVKKDIESI